MDRELELPEEVILAYQQQRLYRLVKEYLEKQKNK